MAAQRGYAFPCFKDKVVIITGASSGMGEATAIAFAKDGAKLSITGRNKERLAAVTQKCVSQGIPAKNVLQLIGDVTDESFIKRMISETVSKLGGIDVLVNNAGVAENSAPGVYDLGKLDRAMNMFVRASYQAIQLALPHLKKTKGAVVNTSSYAGSGVGPYPMFEYNMAKATVNHMTRSLCYDLGQNGININNVSPGMIETPLIDKVAGPGGDALMRVSARKTSFKRNGRPEEVAAVIQFLASPAASFVTGHDLLADGGMSHLPILVPEEIMAEMGTPPSATATL